jgi:hypothetical protein
MKGRHTSGRVEKIARVQSTISEKAEYVAMKLIRA